ncbi:MAG: prohibitin family protein [Candidatus Obscuribacterales bacterium]|nr:prohibitin family protein [Candidatus Obscuribacterales bacterium]
MDEFLTWLAERRAIRRGAMIFGGICLLVIALRSFSIVSTGHVGVTSVFGAVNPTPLNPGLNPKLFWVSVDHVNTQLQTYHVQSAGASEDLQVVSTEITVPYSLVGAIAPEIAKNVGLDIKIDIEQDILNPAIQESVKAVTARYTAEELITQRQKVKVEIENDIKEFIHSTLLEKSCDGGIDIGNVAVTDFSFSKGFNDSIEAKVQSAQSALKAVNSAKKTVTEAEGQAAQIRNNADGEAYNITQNAVARANAINLEGEQLRKNPNIISLRKTERWDGKLPTYMGGQQEVPFIGDQPAKP